jgi:dihydroxyacetone kinase-like protein
MVVLLGSLFLGMSETLEGEEHSAALDLAQMFKDALASVQKQTKARVGGRTMIDALAPAISLLRDGAHKGRASEILRSAADSTQKSAVLTRDMVARFGKAKGARLLGYQDAGATSIAMIFQGFYEGFIGLGSS